MRILLVCSNYPPEPFRVADVAAGLRARGHEVLVITGLPNYPGGRFYQGYGATGPYREVWEGIPVERVPVIPRGKGGPVRLTLNYASFAVSASIRALLLARRGWDVVFVFQLSPVTAILPAALVRAFSRIPLAAWVQDLWPESIAATGLGRSRLLYAVARMFSGWLYRRCDRLLVTSRAFKPRLEALGVSAHRVSHLPQWAEEFYASPNTELESAAGPWCSGFPILFAGNLGRVQALDTILAAAALLVDDPELRWVFVGDGSRRAWLEQEVKDRRLEDRVFILGRRPPSEMPAYFSKSAALLVSLKRDDTMALTVPAKVQSYLASGRPVLGALDGAGAQVLQESGAALVAPADDPGALAEVVRRLRSLSQQERDAMGSRGRAYSERHFSRERCLDTLEAVLEETAQRRAPADVTPA